MLNIVKLPEGKYLVFLRNPQRCAGSPRLTLTTAAVAWAPARPGRHATVHRCQATRLSWKIPRENVWKINGIHSPW